MYQVLLPNLRNEIIPVNYNDTITLRGVYSATNTGCMAMIDADGNYLGRFNFNNANPDHDFVNGVFKFKVTNAACVAVGWYVNQTNPTEFPPANARLIISEGIGIELEITPEYKSVLENTLEISPDKEIDWIAQMFNRGKAIKTFTKKKCIVMWGQSNADGRNVIADAPQYIQDLGYILPKAFLKNSANGAFTVWNQTSSWAFKLITAYYLTEIDNEECYFINLTVGGTSMAETGTTTQHWTPFLINLQKATHHYLGIWRIEF